MNLTHREIELIVDELQQQVVPARIQKIFESTPNTLVFQLRAPGQTFHLLISAEPDQTRLYLVDDKPDQPPHPSPFTMQLRKWLHGAWIESIDLLPTDRVVFIEAQAIDPAWEPTDENEKAPRLPIRFVAELVGRHPSLLLVDEGQQIVGRSPGPTLGDRPTDPGCDYSPPPPPPTWADDDQTRLELATLPADGSRSKALAQRLQLSLAEQATAELRQDLSTRLKRRHKKLKRRVKNIEGDLEKVADADEFRRRGELLQSAYGSVDPGADSVTVPDFYRDGLPPVEIPLDPAKSLQKNIERYFHQYRRYAQAQDTVETRLLESITLCEDLADARKRLRELPDDDQALKSFAQDCYDQGLLKRPQKRSKSARNQHKKLPPYREFEAQSGATILVGRGARQNDELTTSIARGRDLWLHARDWAGSHVVLRLDKDQAPDSEDLVDAAILAAHFSKGSRDTLVDVTYTKAKYVRKPSGAAPGLVTFGGGSTIAVRPEGPRVQGLLDSEISLA